MSGGERKEDEKSRTIKELEKEEKCEQRGCVDKRKNKGRVQRRKEIRASGRGLRREKERGERTNRNDVLEIIRDV